MSNILYEWLGSNPALHVHPDGASYRFVVFNYNGLRNNKGLNRDSELFGRFFPYSVSAICVRTWMQLFSLVTKDSEEEPSPVP